MDKMIRFICNYENNKHYKYENLLNYAFYDLVNIEDEATFTIEIDHKTFFTTSGFNILEFLQQIAQWEMNKGDMLYHCVDTDDNPLISFIEKDGLYTISSPWQKFECKDEFCFSDLISVREVLNG